MFNGICHALGNPGTWSWIGLALSALLWGGALAGLLLLVRGTRISRFASSPDEPGNEQKKGMTK